SSDVLLGHRLAQLEAGEAAHRDVLPESAPGLLHDLADRAVALLDEGLIEETRVLVEALELAFDDTLDHFGGLARLLGLLVVDGPLGLELGGRHLLAADPARRGGSHLHAEV